MRSRTLENHKATLALTDRQREMIVGLMLGDGHLEQSPCTARARLKVEQRSGAREYVEWLHDAFREWVPGGIKTKNTYLPATQKSYAKCYFTTYTHDAFYFYRQLFYVGRRKIIPANIGEILTPLGLAVWFMDDGSLKSQQSRGRIINTHAFTETEVKALCHVLKEKFQMEAWPRRQDDGIQIFISGKSAHVLHRLLEPHIVPVMRYKLPLVRVNNSA